MSNVKRRTGSMAFALAFGALLLSVFSKQATAEERGTKDEARQLAERAAHHLATVGPERAYEDFNNAQGDFVDRDLYVFVLHRDGTIVTHGNKRGFVGKNLLGVRDANGRAIADEAIAAAVAQGAGWTHPYQFPDPYTGKIGDKQSYVILFNHLIVGVVCS